MDVDSPQLPVRHGGPRITQLGDYKIGPKLGSGAMGSVYRATQVSQKRDVAVKVLSRKLADNDLFLQRFEREARVMAGLKHPNFVRCYGLGKQHGRHYLAMELVEGGSLSDWLHRVGKFSVADALHIVLVSARALQYAHDKHLVHRDVKPDNILLTPTGQLKFADLGLVRSLTEEITLSLNGRGAGTPVYVAPEQARNARDADGRSDLYALGCTLYHLLTGELPFRGASAIDIIVAKLNGIFRPVRELVPDLPPAVDKLVSRLLAPHPDDRFQNCAEVIAAVETLGLANERLSFIATVPQFQMPTEADLEPGEGTQDFEGFPTPCLTDTPESERLTTPPVRLTWWEKHQGAVFGLLLTAGAVVCAAGVAILAARR